MMDAREADLEPGEKWTGWHRIEKDLWPAARRELHAADARGARVLRRRPDGEHRRPSTSGSRTSTTPSTRSPTARAACSRRSPPARSPARRSTGRTPTCGTSRPTSTAPGSASRASSRSSSRRTPSSPTSSTTRFADAAGAARRAADRRRLHVLRRPDARTRSRQLVRRRQRALRAALEAHRGGAVLTTAGQSRDADWSAAAWPPPAVARRVRGRSRPATAADGEPATRAPTSYAFRGEHQAGIVTPAQDRLHFAAFDVTTDARDAAGRAAAGLDRRRRPDDPRPSRRRDRRRPRARATSRPTTPARRSGSPPSGLTITFGFGPGALPRRRRQGPLRPRRPAARGAAHAAALPGRRARPREVVRRPLRPGLRRRPAGRRARDPQPGPDRLRHGRGALVAARLRPHVDDVDRRSRRRATCSASRTAPPTSRPRRPRTSTSTSGSRAGDDPKADWLAGGSYLVARRINMNIEIWDRQPLGDQEAFVGRTKDDRRPAVGRRRVHRAGLRRCPAATAAGHRRRRARPAGAPRLQRRRPDAAPRLQLRRRLQPARRPRRRAVLHRLTSRDPDTHFIPIQNTMAKSDALMEYLKVTGSALFAVPPGVGPGEYVGQALVRSC